MRVYILGLRDSYYPVEMSTDGQITYTAFMDKIGNWYILKMAISGTATTIRYYKGSVHDDLQQAWLNRSSLSYGYPTIFKGN